MKNKRFAVILILLCLCASAYAATDYFNQYKAYLSREAIEAASMADIPPNILSREEQELFRLGYAFGYDNASKSSSVTRSIPTDPTYIANISTKKFHRPDCYMVNSILFENREDLYCTYAEAIKQGFSPCGKCLK